MTARGVERDRLAWRRRLPPAGNRSRVARERGSIANAAAIERDTWRPQDAEDIGGASEMLAAIAAGHVVVDGANAMGLEIRDRRAALAGHTGIEENDLALGRNQDRSVAFADAHEVHLQLAIRLRG